MRAIERAAIDSGDVTGLDLMERAGAGVVAAVFTHWPDMAKAPHRAVVLCGPGNNGGDGFVVAHHLRARGWRVDLFLYGRAEALPPDAKQMYLRWAAEGPVHLLSFPTPRAAEIADLCKCATPDSGSLPMLFVDALFGIGLSRPLQALGDIILHVDGVHGDDFQIVAIDVPSGLDADTGLYVSGEGIDTPEGFRADLTVTFHALKRGHVEGMGPKACGAVKVVDIGLSPWDAVHDRG